MAHVVYVHGLWMPGDESLILRRRLAADFGLTLHPFRYLATGTMSAITATPRVAAIAAGAPASEITDCATLFACCIAF